MSMISNVKSWVLSITSSLDVFVLVSLSFQYVLLMVAPWRKNSSVKVYPMVWNMYLAGHGVAHYVMGTIPNYNSKGGRTGDLRVFWGAFIILHYGCPNTIIGVSLKDNDLWLRSVGHFVTLSYTLVLVLYRRSFQKNELWWPTACMFLVGALRFMEKVICNFLARLTKFRESTLPTPDPGVNYVQLMTEMYSSGNQPKVNIDIPTERCSTNIGMGSGSDEAVNINNGLTQVDIVRKASKLFDEFQGLFVNSVYTYEQRSKTRNYFLGTRLNAEQAFSICEVELNFAYDLFYTKAILIHRFKYLAAIVNLLCFILELTSLLLWILIDKHKFHKPSVLTTYSLLVGSIAVDVLSFLMFLTSDWCIAKVVTQKQSKPPSFYEMLLLKPRKSDLVSRRVLFMFSSVFGFPRSLFRWSKIIQQLHLIRCCLSTRTGPSGFSTKKLSKELRNFIFKELVLRSRSAEHPKDVEELCSARGLWALDLLSRNCQDWNDVGDTFKYWISDVDYEESLILWHIATTLCSYNTPREENPEDDEAKRRIYHLCEFSQIISNHLLHLLIKQPQMMPPSAVVPARMIFNDTCADARRFFSRAIKPLTLLPPWPSRSKRHLEACEKIIQVDTDVIPPRQIRGDESKSLLFDACHLAKTLQRVSKEKRISEWEIISKVWVELLFYSAAHSSPTEHLEKLQRGGELLTIVWLLMAHLGLGNHFRPRKDRDIRAEFVSAKH